MKIVLATRNLGKVMEFERLFQEFNASAAADGHQTVEVLGLKDFPDMPDVEETGATLLENSLLKSSAIAEFTSLPSLADDSGLFVEALNGDPGIYSARWAGVHGDDAANTAKVLRQMAQLRGTPHFTDRAAFRTSVSLILPESPETPIVESGEMVGRIIEAPRGDFGFGYDPIFIPDGFDRTSAELLPHEKDAISHRGKAMRSMAARIREFLAPL